MDRFVEHFRLDVEIAGDCTRETWYHSDPKNGIRRQKIIEEWKKQRRIGAGAGGEVFEEHSNLGSIRAIKAIRKPKNSDLSNYIKELVAMGQLSKDNDLFVELYGWYECDQFLYLAMEYLELGHITMCFEDCMSESDVRVVAKQLLEGVARMHEKGIVHRDIKPQNILVFRRDPIWIKIGDFGSSKLIQKNESGPNSLVGTEDFAAPEVLQLLDNAPETLEYTNAVDIWSVGCVLYYLLSRNLPFPSVKLLYEHCRAEKPRFPNHHLRANSVSPEGISFIRNLMALQPSRRVSASVALLSPWITNEAILQQAAEASNIYYHWQAGPQAFPYQGTDGYFERRRSVSRRKNVPISTVPHISSDRPTLPPPHYIVNSPIVPVVPPAESNPSYFLTGPIPHYLYPTIPPAEYKSVGRPTVRDSGRNKTAVTGDMKHHHSLQQDDTAPASENPYQEIYLKVLSPQTAEYREIRKKRPRRQDRRADANNLHDAELSRQVTFGNNSVFIDWGTFLDTPTDDDLRH